MKTAICAYELGKEKEISANIFKNKYEAEGYKFICPECGEQVSFVEKEKTKYFKHHKETEISKECDKRVKGSKNLTVYEKLGLPLYLRKNCNGDYYFSILFKKIPTKAFLACKEKDSYIEIYDKFNIKEYERFYLNRGKFLEDESNFITISTLPKNSSRLYIRYSESSVENILKKYWSNYINCPLPINGALFSAEENEGKIIRPWENISTYTEYYWVKKSKKIIPYEEIKMEKVGKICLKGITYNVFKCSFNVNLENRKTYKRIANYLEENLNVILLEKKSNIYPIWPPCVKSNDGYEVNKVTKVYNKVLSSNDNPKVYSYRKSLINALNIKVDHMGKEKISAIDATYEEVLINVDRKVTSTGIIIRKNELSDVKEDRILINLENGDSIKGKIELNDTRDITIESLCDINLIKVGNGGKVEEFDKKNNFKIKDVKFGDRYFLLSNINKIAEITIKEKIINNKIFDEKQLLRTIKQSSGTNLIAITKDVRKTITCNLKYIKNKETKTLLRKYLLENRVPLRVYMILRGGR